MEGVGNVGLAPSTQPPVISMLLPRKGQVLRNVSIQVSYQIPKYVVTNVDTNVKVRSQQRRLKRVEVMKVEDREWDQGN